MPLPSIIYEDAALVAFDKPGGLAVVAERRSKSTANLLGLVQEKFGPGVANVHRLDTETSGVVLCAKTKPALDFLSGQFQSKTADQRFLTLVTVLPPERAVKDVADLRAVDVLRIHSRSISRCATTSASRASCAWARAVGAGIP